MASTPTLCDCAPRSLTTAPSGLSLVHTCTTCGASVIELSGNMPAFVHDTTIYEVVVDMNPAVLKAHLALLKKKSGRSTPELLQLACEGGQLVLFNDRAIKIHYELRELANAGCVVRVAPPYPHDPQA